MEALWKIVVLFVNKNIYVFKHYCTYVDSNRLRGIDNFIAIALIKSEDSFFLYCKVVNIIAYVPFFHIYCLLYNLQLFRSYRDLHQGLPTDNTLFNYYTINLSISYI